MGYIDDDSDIKIAQFGKGRDNLPDKMIADHEQQKQNGNLERARAFGAAMAEKVYAYDAPEPEQKLNKQILYVFASTVAFENFTPSRLTAVTALSSFYDRLKGISLEFYNLISNSAAFSFYYLCLHNRPNMAQSVGETFAMMCGDNGNSSLSKKGSELYASFIEEARCEAVGLEFIL